MNGNKNIELKHPFVKRVLSLVGELSKEKTEILKLISEYSGVQLRLLYRVYSCKQKNFSASDAKIIANAISTISAKPCIADDIIQATITNQVSRKFKLVR